MIKCSEGKVSMSGNVIDVASDICAIIHSFRESLLMRGIPKENADEMIALCGRLAFTETPEDMSKVLEDMIND